MNDIEGEAPRRSLIKSRRAFVKNSLFSILHIYSGFFLSLVTSFILARMITQQEWGYLILALSYTSLFSLILIFFPPSFGITINYYIASYHSLEQNTKLKSFIRNALGLRILFVSLFFGIAIALFIFSIELFQINLGIYTNLFLILSPLIIIKSLNLDIYDIYRALNLFNLVFYLLVLNYVIQIIGFVILFFFQHLIILELLAVIILLSSVIPFLINVTYLTIKIKFKIKKTEEPPENFRATLINLYKYGTPFSVKNFGDSVLRELQTQSIGIFESPEVVTGYNIGANYTNVGSQSLNSLSNPLAVSFTRLYAKEETEEIIKIYQTIFNYILFGVLFITGLLYFIIDFFLFLIYGEIYIDYSIILKIMILPIIFNIQNIFFLGLIRAMNKGIIYIPIYLIWVPLRLICFIVVIMYYGIIWALFTLLIINILYFIVLFILINKIFKIKANIKKTLFQYFAFFISFGLTLLLEFFFLNDFNNYLLNLLHLDFFRYFNLFSIIIFCFSYICLNIIFKIIRKQDLNNIEALLVRENYLTKAIRKVLNIIKKLVRD
ncbi:MAG: lipopolysaccharide biosynthesis protein [Promethearchaeota archaeon]